MRSDVISIWGGVTSQPDFANKFLRLTSGLDGKSCETVIRLLMQIERICTTKAPFLDIFSREEQEELRLLQENFFTKVMQISDDIFAWRNYLLPREYTGASVLYYRHGLHTLKAPSYVKGKAVIDAGGYIGDSALVLAELNPSAIHTFEPVPKHFALLKRTIELNRITNAVPECMALGAENSTVPMYLSGGSSTIKTNKSAKQGEYIDVTVRRLDDYVAERQIKVGLIKTDIEGAEPDLLEGAKKTICEQKPILLISIYHNPHDFFEIKPLIESWNLGYRFSIYHPTIDNPSIETLLIAEPDS